jgi:hypothetical protein
MRPSSFLCSFLAATALIVHADQVKLEDGSTITGEVLELDAGSALKIQSGIATAPLSLRAEQIRKVSFSKDLEASERRDATLTLVNGDRLPCDVIGIDAEQVRIMTNAAGALSIGRNIVSSVELGIRPRRVLYEGPAGLEDWKVDEGWLFQDNALLSEGRGSVSRSFEELPESFSLAFLMSWAQRPNFQVYFCSDQDQAGGGKHDRYYLQFGAAGFELKRQSSEDPTYHTLGTIQRGPSTFNEPKVNIELRVDRDRRLIQVFLDGKLEGSFPDPLATAPKGNGVIFLSNLNEGEGHLISDIRIREWDSVGDRHRSEDRGEGDGDALIDHEGQRFSGELIQTKDNDNNPVALFKSPHFPKPLEIPLEQISTVFLSRPTESLDQSALVLNVANGGFLSASGCRFVDDRIKLEHPLLGSMDIARSSVRSMVKRQANDEDDDADDNSKQDEE